MAAWTQEKIDSYIEWMYNPDNEFKCRECPENRGFDKGPNLNRYRCGQYRCWVSVHCRKGEV